MNAIFLFHCPRCGKMVPDNKRDDDNWQYCDQCHIEFRCEIRDADDRL